MRNNKLTLPTSNDTAPPSFHDPPMFLLNFLEQRRKENTGIPGSVPEFQCSIGMVIAFDTT